MGIPTVTHDVIGDRPEHFRAAALALKYYQYRSHPLRFSGDVWSKEASVGVRSNTLISLLTNADYQNIEACTLIHTPTARANTRLSSMFMQFWSKVEADDVEKPVQLSKELDYIHLVNLSETPVTITTYLPEEDAPFVSSPIKRGRVQFPHTKEEHALKFNEGLVIKGDQVISFSESSADSIAQFGNLMLVAGFKAF